MAHLKPKQDAFGHTLWNMMKGDAMPAVIERDDGWIGVDLYGSKLYFAPYRKWPGIEKRALKYVRGRVLDVGTGAGRHAIYLQEQGHPVTGIDDSPLAVEVSRQRGLKDGRALSVSQASTLAPLMFDSIVMLGHNLALLGGLEQGRALLRRFKKITAPGARIIGTTVDPYAALDQEHMAYQRRNRRNGRMSGQLRFRMRYESYTTPWFDYLFLSRPELEELVEGTGWRLTAFHPAEDAPNYAAVLERD